jgi:hypothetical protein
MRLALQMAVYAESGQKDAQNNQTYTNKIITAAKKANHTRQPTPVLSAILNILFIVPRSRTLVFSNESFIFSAIAEESLISVPIATVS